MKGRDLAGAWRTFWRLKKSVTAGGSDRNIRAVNNSSCSDWFVVKGRLVALRSEGKTKIKNKTDMQTGVRLWNVMVAVVVLENGVRWCVVDGVRWYCLLRGVGLRNRIPASARYGVL